MAKINIEYHVSRLEPVEEMKYTYEWFKTQWDRMHNNHLLLTLDGTYIRTAKGFMRA